MEVYLDPARRLLDRLAVVVGAPALDEGQAEDAEAAQVVDADSGRRGEREAAAGGGGRRRGGGGRGGRVGVAGDGGGLRGGRRVRRRRLLLHLAVALTEIKYLQRERELNVIGGTPREGPSEVTFV